MKKVEKVFVLLVLIGIVLRLMLVPRSAALMFLSSVALCLFYFYLGFALFNDIRLRSIFKKSSYDATNTMHILAGIASGFALSAACVGIMFKFLSWPGSFFQLLLAIFACTIIFVISLIKMKGSNIPFYKRILTRIVSFGSVCVLLLTIPQNTFFEIMWRNHPDYIRAEENLRKDPGNKELLEKAKEEEQKLHGH